MINNINNNFYASMLPLVDLSQEPIISAIKLNDCYKLTTLLNKTSFYSSINQEGHLIEIAIESGSEEALNLLLINGIKPNHESLFMTISNAFTKKSLHPSVLERMITSLCNYKFNPFKIVKEKYNNVFITDNFHSKEIQKEFIDYFFRLYWETQLLEFESMSINEIAINGISIIQKNGYANSIQEVMGSLVNQNFYVPDGCFGIQDRFYSLLCHREGYYQGLPTFISKCPNLKNLSKNELLKENIYILFTLAFLDSAFLSPNGAKVFSKNKEESVFSKALKKKDLLFNECFAHVALYHLNSNLYFYSPESNSIDDCVIFIYKTFEEAHRLGKDIPKKVLSYEKIEL